MPWESAGENRDLLLTIVMTANLDEPRGRESPAFTGNSLRVQAAADVDVFVFVPGEAAGCMVFEERSLERLDEPHRDVDQRERQPVNEFDPLDKRTYLEPLSGEQSAATFDRLAAARGCGHTHDRVGLHLRIDGTLGRVFPRVAGRRRRTGCAQGQSLRQPIAPVCGPPHGEQTSGLAVHLDPQ